MKFFNVFRTVAAVSAAAFAAQASAQDSAPIDSASFTNGGSHLSLKWLGDPGAPHAAYRVYGKSALTNANEEWKAASGFVTPVTSWTLEETVEIPSTDDAMFFLVRKVDRDGPSIEYVSPAKDAVSVPADSPISVRISDESGVRVDNSLAIYVGDVRHAFGDPGVTWEDGVLTYAGGNLGEPGATVDVWATATDTCGNVGSSEQSLLVLESAVATITSDQPQVVPFLVIGAGENSVEELVEKVSDSPGTAAKSIKGSRAAGSDTLEITGTTSSNLVFAYTGNAYELLAEGQLWASDDENNIFYRRITAIGTPADGTVTVDTTEATLADFFVGGSFNSDDGDWTEYDVVDLGEGEAVSAQSRRRAVRPRLGGSTAKSYTTNGVLRSDWLNASIPPNVPLEFVGDLGDWEVGAGFSVAADFAVLKRKFNSCDLAVTGAVHVSLYPELAATTNATYSNTWTKTIANVKKTFAGMIGPVPVWVDVGLVVPITLTVQAQVTNAGVKAVLDIDRALDFRWHLSDDQWKQIGNGNTGWRVSSQTNFFQYEVVGEAGVRASVKPELTVKVYSLVGAYGWVEPYLEANAAGYVRGQNTVAPDFHYLVTAYAGLNAEIGLASAIWSDDWGTPPHKTFSPLRKELLRIEGTNTPPSFASKPFDYEAKAGETVMLSALAKGTPPLRYTWYHNGVDTGRRETYITMTAAEATAGNYTVEVRNGYGDISATARVSIATNTPEVGVVGMWRFLYQWEGKASCSYAARVYADGSMHDTSPNDYWWDWHVNGKTVRFETREKWDGQSAIYRGARWNDKFMAGTMTSPSGLTGTWSMEWVSSDPEASISGLRALRAAQTAGEEEAEVADVVLFDPAGMPVDEADALR